MKNRLFIVFKMIINIIQVILCIFSEGTVLGQQTDRINDAALKKANDPLAERTLNVHDYIVTSLYGADQVTMNQLLFRYTQPVGPFLLRATMPVVTQSAIDRSPSTGFGDFSILALFKIEKQEGVSFGLGPLLVAPTASHDMGQGKWQTGISALAYFSESSRLQMGTLIQWQFSFAGQKEKDKVSQLIPQIFLIWQAGNGVYLRSSGEWSFDFKNGHYNIPLGLGIGKVIKMEKIVFNLFAEPQFSVAVQGTGQAKSQLLIGINTQF